MEELSITHYLPPSIDKREEWVRVAYLTRKEGGDPAKYFRGKNITLFQLDLQIKEQERQGKIIRLEKPWKIKDSRILWITPTNEIWWASEDNPVADQERVQLAVSQSALVVWYRNRL